MRRLLSLLLTFLLPPLASACSSSSSSELPADAGALADAPPSPAHDAGADAPHATDAQSPEEDAAPTAPDADADGSLAGWTLTWSDEFNAPDGTAVDATKWNQETGNQGWQNNQELEYYTAGTANAVQQGGSLVITATDQGASQYTCGYGTCRYTSARFNTQNKFQQQYGRFEARIQIPEGQGLWPAWWMLGDDISTVGWPACGEIDVMENVGKTPSTNYGSLHGPGYSGGQALTASYSLPDGGVLGDAFHVFAAEWAPNVVRFYVDGVLYETRTPADVPAGDTWVYDHPFFLIVNVAVGGNFPGSPDGTTTFPQTMKVDYIRVYTATP